MPGTLCFPFGECPMRDSMVVINVHSLKCEAVLCQCSRNVPFLVEERDTRAPAFPAETHGFFRRHLHLTGSHMPSA